MRMLSTLPINTTSRNTNTPPNPPTSIPKIKPNTANNPTVPNTMYLISIVTNWRLKSSAHTTLFSLYSAIKRKIFSRRFSKSKYTASPAREEPSKSINKLNARSDRVVAKILGSGGAAGIEGPINWENKWFDKTTTAITDLRYLSSRWETGLEKDSMVLKNSLLISSNVESMERARPSILSFITSSLLLRSKSLFKRSSVATKRIRSDTNPRESWSRTRGIFGSMDLSARSRKKYTFENAWRHKSTSL